MYWLVKNDPLYGLLDPFIMIILGKLRTYPHKEELGPSTFPSGPFGCRIPAFAPFLPSKKFAFSLIFLCHRSQSNLTIRSILKFRIQELKFCHLRILQNSTFKLFITVSESVFSYQNQFWSFTGPFFEFYTKVSHSGNLPFSNTAKYKQSIIQTFTILSTMQHQQRIWRL